MKIMGTNWLFENARVLKDDFTFEVGSVSVRDGRIAEVGQPKNTQGLERIDASDLTLIPGLIDTHFHGALGNLFGTAGPEGIREVAAFEAAHGITAIIPAISTAPEEALLTAIRDFRAVMASGSGGARLEGIHLEGPFLSMKHRGGQMAEYLLPPSVERLRTYWEASEGILRILTLAPEEGEGLEVIRAARERGITVALGHTGASYDTAKMAIDCGASISTHTFNGMPSLHHRSPGVLGAVLTDDRVSCEIIADFVHLHPATVSLICRAKGLDRVHLVSDSMYATGLPDGDYSQEGRTRHIRDGVCYLDGGTLSGSTYPVSYGVKNLLTLGIPLEKAVMTATRNSARAAGLLEHTGTITPGKCGDLVLLDGALQTVATFVDGVPVYTAEGVSLCG
ncbi:MAG: N-acetylglucosamine-6-phosphate deacetylase [Clostridiales bacterium]|nr:N-acetylglucosamine-6-phosphate deacetylase [Clostridiales bacterium]